MGRRIVITSGKGGVGKTTVTANLGLALAETGVGVALIDADIGLNNLDVVMQLESRVVYDLGDVAHGACRLKQALIRDFRRENLYLLPSSKINMDKITLSQFSAIVSELANMFDYVLVDSPAGIDNGFHRAVSACREALVVVTPHVGSIRDANKVIGLLPAYGILGSGIIVNRIRKDMVARSMMMSASEIANLLNAPLIAKLYEDDNISLNGTANASRRGSWRSYRALACHISGTQTPSYDPLSRKSILGWFNKK
ncbi:MAG: septum site-determining protein MinD [Christensenellaceae bacterium]|jgi:septum site-determining protein MinD|nr:septum site-determining protein MinD [Christensenellaceae bacterium]